jgi:hypothetical protein
MASFVLKNLGNKIEKLKEDIDNRINDLRVNKV